MYEGQWKRQNSLSGYAVEAFNINRLKNPTLMQFWRCSEHIDVDRTANLEHHWASLLKAQKAEKCGCISVLLCCYSLSVH